MPSSRALRSLAVAGALALAAAPGAGCSCSGSGGTPDEALGGLVHADRKGPPPIDVDRAVRDVAELGRALAMPHHVVSAALGPHVFAGTSSTETREADKVIETLTDTTSIEIDGDGSFHAALENSADLGREAYWSGGMLYLRARYGKFHRRAPAAEHEPEAIRDDVFATLGAYFDLVAAGAEISDKGAVQHAGRAGRKVEIKLAPTARARGAAGAGANAKQRAWRADATVRSVSGEVILDALTGAPLQGGLEGVVVFNQEGRTFEMRVSVTHTTSAIGAPHPITPPALEDTVATPARLGEVEERDLLLKDIAPPTRRGAAAPTGPAEGAGAGSAGGGSAGAGGAGSAGAGTTAKPGGGGTP